MRFWFIACLMACLELPVGAEPSSPEITPEEAKAIAKEIVDNLRAHLARQRKNQGEAESPSEREGFQECSFNAGQSTHPELRAEYFPLRTDHVKPCPGLWRVLKQEVFGALYWFISIYGYPQGKMGLSCYKRHPTGTKWRFYFTFKDHWTYQRWSRSNFRRPRNKKERVHLQLGLLSKVEAAEEGEGFTLKQATIDFKWPNRSKRISDQEIIHSVKIFDEEAFDLVRKIYHSEALSWTDLRTGEVNTILTGEMARSAIDEMMGHCGYSLTDAEPSSPSQSSQR